MKRSWWHAVLVAAGVAAAPLPAAAQGLKPSSTIPVLESLVQRDSNDAELHYRLAIAYWSRKRFDDAERSLRAAVSIERRFAAAYLALGFLPYARRRRLLEDEAKGEVPPAWHEALIESSRLRRLAFLIDPLVDLQILGAVTPIQASPLGIDRAGRLTLILDPFSAFVRGDYQLAYTIFDGMVTERFKDAPRDSIPSALLWYRGISAGHVGLYDVAIRDFEVLLDRSLKAERSDSIVRIPLQTNDYRYFLALFNQRAKRFADATALYKEALASDLGLFMAHVQMGRIFEENRTWPEAIDHFQSAVATSPDDPSLLLDLGVVLREAGRRAEAETTLAQGMEANPRDSRVPYHLGVTLQEEGKLREARVAFTRFVALAPSRYGRQLADARRRLAGLP